MRRYQAVVSLRGENERGRFSGRLLVVFVRPSSGADPEAVEAMRLELFAPVGGSRWTLVASPGEVRLVVPRERAFAEGEELEEFTGPLLGVSVGREAIAALLVGSGVPIGGSENLRSLPANGSAVLGSGAAILVGRSGRRRPGAEGRGPRLRGSLSRPLPAAGTPGATPGRGRVRAYARHPDDRGTEVNTSLHPDSFEARTPPGYRRAEVRELSQASRLPER